MNTSCKTALAGCVLAAATSALASPPTAEGEPSAHRAQPLTTEAVIADLVASRQAPFTHPRDGEWYNVPAPLGGMVQVRSDTAGAAQALPTQPAALELDRK